MTTRTESPGAWYGLTVRSTAEYRRIVSARVLHRLIREAGGR